MRILPYLALIVCALSACSTVPAWERDLLAQEKMLPNPDPMQSYVDDHIYFSKEAATSGQGLGGGGCGCN